MTSCFVIGPIGNMYAEHGSPERTAYESALDVYENVIVAACSQLGIDAVRSDQISITGDITDQIFRRLYEADLVIADITGANANVMYELGLRHSLDKLTIQVADVSSALPFDVKTIRTIHVKRTAYGLITARNTLVSAMEAGLRGELDRVAATRIWEAAGRGAIDEIATLLNDSGSGALEAEEEDGYLDVMLTLEDAFTGATATAQGISESMTNMGSTANDFGQRLQQMNKDDDTQAARMSVVEEFANALSQHAETFSGQTDEFKTRMLVIDSKMKPLLRALAENESLRGVEGTAEFMSKVEELAEAARGSLNGLATFGGSITQLGQLSKSLRRPTSLIATGVATMADGVSILDEWDFSIRQIRTHAN